LSLHFIFIIKYYILISKLIMRTLSISILLGITLLQFSAAAKLASESRGIGIYTGLSLPLKEFGNGSTSLLLEKTSTGFANPGPSAGVKYLQFLGLKSLKWALDGSVILNSFDEEGFEKNFRRQYSSELQNADIERLKTYSDYWWVSIPLLTGPWIEGHFNPDLAMYTSFMGGVYFTRVPRITMAGYYNNGVYLGNVVYSSDISAAFGIALDAGIKYKIFTFGSRLSLATLKSVNTGYDASLFGKSNTKYYSKEYQLFVIQLLVGFVL